MSDILHALKQIFCGLKKLDEKIKYQMISIFIALPHLLFSVVFYVLNIDILFIYNFIIVVFYISLTILLGKGRKFYLFVFVSAFIEIIFHSSLASLLLGWHWGFMSYTVGLIPMVFYMEFTLSYLKKGIIVPAMVSVIVCIVYFTVRYISVNSQPVYMDDSYITAAARLYMYNMLLTFFFLLVTSLLFATEIRYMQNYLETENNSLAIMANYDPLTRLMNRRGMNIFLKEAMADVKKDDRGFCLLMLDIDDFKMVNDTYGHSVGDNVLVSVAGVLKNNLREDDRVCRWGGEEMLVFIHGGIEESEKVAHRICTDVRDNKVDIDAGQINVTVTIGVVEYKNNDTLRNMIETADRRLYRGKREGKNRVIWQDI